VRRDNDPGTTARSSLWSTEDGSTPEREVRVESRDEWLARVFVELADTLVADFDLIDFLSVLAERCVDLLHTAEVGISLADSRGRLQVMASSTERMHVLEQIEMANDEGPCLDCFRSGSQVLNRVLEDNESRWPRFAPAARRAGFQTVHALPLRLRSNLIGVMNVFDVERRDLSLQELNLAQALADVATIGILQERTVKEHVDLSVQLQGALNSRVVIEQAKGIVVERLGVDMEEAFALLRSYARGSRLQLSIVAEGVIDGTLSVSDLTAARGAGRASERPPHA
jgi:GAF domain-containing protein